MFISAKEVKDKLMITSQTLYNWRTSNKIKYKMYSDGIKIFKITEEKLKSSEN